MQQIIPIKQVTQIYEGKDPIQFNFSNIFTHSDEFDISFMEAVMLR